jgi:hypothetical protein
MFVTFFFESIYSDVADQNTQDNPIPYPKAITQTMK